MVKVWTEERIDLLTTYLRNGLSNAQIAKKLNVSIDSIGGAITRYDLKSNKLPKTSTSKFVESLDFKSLSDIDFEKEKEKAKLRWKIAKASKKKIKKRPYKVGLFFPDVHTPHQNDPMLKSVYKLMDDITFDVFTLMGDFMDFGCISHWNRNRHRTLELKRLKSDYIIGNSILDEFDKRLPEKCEKHYLYGNHEDWISNLLDEIPALEGLIEPEECLQLDKRNYKVYPYNELVKFGRLYATHGIYVTTNPIKKHLNELKVNIIFAHTHKLGMEFSSSMAREIAFAGYNIGAACDLSPDYMRNRPNAWTHGFAVVYFFPNGYFDVQLVRVIDGQFIFNGKVYSGKK